MTGGVHNLTHQFLHILRVFPVLALLRHVYCILLRVVMGDIGSLTAYRHKIILHLFYETVDSSPELSLLRPEMTALVGGAVAVKHRAVLVGIGVRHDCLREVEQHTDLTLLHTLVFLLPLRGQFLVVGGGDDILRVMPVDIVVPCIPVERHPLLLAEHRDVSGLCRVEEHILCRRIVIPVGEQLEHKGVERTDRRAFRIYTGSRHPGMVEPHAAVAFCIGKRLVD